MRSVRAIDRAERGQRARSGAAAARGGALQVVPDARGARDREVVRLREAGCLMVEISRELGISSERVAQAIESAGGVDRERVLAARFQSHLRRAHERLDEVLARFRAGEHPQLIARELGLDHRAVWRIVRELSTDADRTKRARALTSRRRPRFSDGELLDGLQRVAHKLGHVPTDAEYDRLAAGLGLASSATLHHRFDGWRGALRSAGLEAQPRRRWSLRWDAAACWRALESVADEIGDPPRYRRYQQLAGGRDDLPSGRIVLDRLGLWSQIAAELMRRKLGGESGDPQARRVTEMRPRMSLPARPPRPSRSFSDEQLLAGVRAVAESVGHRPSRGDYERLAKPLGLACHATVCTRLGSWSGALTEAGFEPVAPVRSYSKKWDAQACWSALDGVADELGEWPRYGRYERLAAGRGDLPSGALLRKRLGPWSQIAAALRERHGADRVARALPEETHVAA
jgi:DNA-binding CsgD family transcriptional regulator/plasmid stabilization system protein ParE